MSAITSVSTIETSQTELLGFLTSHAASNDYPFALWRLPDSGIRHLLIANDHRLINREDTVLEELAAGFMFAPFDRDAQSIFLPADFLFSFRGGRLDEETRPLSPPSRALLEKRKDAAANGTVKPASPAKTGSIILSPSGEFQKLVERSLEEVQRGSFEKVVPSRTMQVPLPADFDIISAFDRLSEKYSNALVSLVNIPGVGCWMGATPEILVSVEDKSIFRTVALAGTQPYVEGMNLRRVAWTQKEIEEQALVERYVISCFKRIRLREYEEHGPKTSVAGNLIHLKSDFTVDMKATNFPQLGTVMLKLLHPTSAVCGMPLESSLEFLKKNEGYNRGFYSGYLGPVNIDNDINIFVNLRCMQLLDRSAILYAGAGVTIDSIPEQEVEETEIKFNTLLNLIF